MKYLLFCCFALWGAGLYGQNHWGHAHNDYDKDAPLDRSLVRHFQSIEVDVYLKRGQLRVSHLPFRLKNKPLLKDLYLEPLVQRIDQNGGLLWPGDSSQLVLYIDFKTQKQTFSKLEALLEPYQRYLQRWQGGNSIWGPIRVLIDGHMQEVAQQEVRFFQVQLPYEKYGVEANVDWVPRLNAKWGDHFKWKGKGRMTLKEEEKLQEMLRNVQTHGRTIRFYATGDNPAIWKKLLELEAGWINVDDVERWMEFLRFEGLLP